jgi:hypothetical protein
MSHDRLPGIEKPVIELLGRAQTATATIKARHIQELAPSRPAGHGPYP